MKPYGYSLQFQGIRNEKRSGKNRQNKGFLRKKMHHGHGRNGRRQPEWTKNCSWLPKLRAFRPYSTCGILRKKIPCSVNRRYQTETACVRVVFGLGKLYFRTETDSQDGNDRSLCSWQHELISVCDVLLHTRLFKTDLKIYLKIRLNRPQLAPSKMI